MFSNFFFTKIMPFFKKMWEICGTAGQATDDNIIRRMHVAY